MKIKQLSIRDADSIAALFSDVFTHEPWNDDWSDAAQLSAYIRDLAGQAYSLTLGYLDGDRLVGLALGHIKHWYTGTEYVIEEFCVDRHCQGRGVGSAFMGEIEGFLKARGVRHIFLQTDRTVPAYAFYQRLGFQELRDDVSFAKPLK